MMEVTYARQALGLYIIYYYVTLLPDFSFFYPAQLMWVALLVLIGLAALLTVGRLNRWLVFFLFLLNLVFHHACPFIIHEPQQLMSLFLLLFVFFLPPQNCEKADPWIVKALVLALGIYYMTAGVKKMLDPHWLSGQALGELLRWEGLARSNALVAFLKQQDFLSKTLNYVTLGFELCFLPLVFTRAWKVLLVVGIGFHLMIAATMEVGTFSAIMMVWYLLLVRKTSVKNQNGIYWADNSS